MNCLKTRVCAGYFYGLPESKIDKVTLENINVTYDKDFKDYEAPAMIYEGERLNNAPYLFYNVKEVEIRDVYIEDEKVETFKINNK
ncbi:MAG: hypothetical protein J6S49_06040 [Erysipelotrichaceae bacterium]|nr:hypothetical protein [Erysipelotrichaceae bacterium]